MRICDQITSDFPAEVIRDRILEVLTGGRQIDVFGKEAMPFRSLFRKELLSMPEDVKRAGRFLARAALPGYSVT